MPPTLSLIGWVLLAFVASAHSSVQASEQPCVIWVPVDGLSNINETVAPSPFSHARLGAIASDVTCKFAVMKVAKGQAPQRQASKAVLMAVTQDGFESSFQDYWPNIMTKLMYCDLHGYDCLIYVHREQLPPTHTGHFSKVAGINSTLFELGYDWVLFTDWDSWVSATSAVMLESFMAPFPQADMIMNGEADLCTCVLLFKRSSWSRNFLQQWWDAAYTGCCNNKVYDQIAFKHVLGSALAIASGDRTFYNPDDDKWKTGVQPLEPVDIATVLALQNTSFLGLVTHRSSGMVHHDKNMVPLRAGSNAVQLHNCLGLWQGCIPSHVPALLYHHGHSNKLKWFGFHIGKDMRALLYMALLQQAR